MRFRIPRVPSRVTLAMFTLLTMIVLTILTVAWRKPGPTIALEVCGAILAAGLVGWNLRRNSDLFTHLRPLRKRFEAKIAPLNVETPYRANDGKVVVATLTCSRFLRLRGVRVCIFDAKRFYTALLDDSNAPVECEVVVIAGRYDALTCGWGSARVLEIDGDVLVDFKLLMELIPKSAQKRSLRGTLYSRCSADELSELGNCLDGNHLEPVEAL